jgi:hypothetical protein
MAHNIPAACAQPGKIIRNMFLMLLTCGLCACNTVQQMREGLRPKPLISTNAVDKAEIYGEIAAAQKRRSEAFVQIVGGDIELPPTAGQDKPGETRKYHIDVWFDNSVIGASGIEDAIQDGEIIIEVLGAKAKILKAFYGESKDILPSSRHMVRIELDSRDLTQSFTVMAKAVRRAERQHEEQRADLDASKNKLKEAMMACQEQCRKYLSNNEKAITAQGSRAIVQDDAQSKLAFAYIAAGEAYERLQSEQNPYMASKTIRVFNGDLHTQVYMLSDEETRDGFGTHFARYFYVGKAYFRNRHTDKKLIVHTTSLRARTVFYREPVKNREGDSWRDKLARFGDEKDDGSIYSRYDYIRDEPDLANNALSINAEDTILDIVKSKEMIEILLAAKSAESNQEIENMVFGRINASLGLDRSAETKEKAFEFISFALIATKKAIMECEVPKNSRQNSAELYAKVFSAISIEENVEKQVDRVTPDLKGDQRASTKDLVICIAERQRQSVLARSSASSSASPVALDLRKRVGLTDKIAAASRDTYWQQRLAGHGYLWQDFYRPMTFEAVLLSLAAKTKSHPNNRIIEYLQSFGVIAGSLVGLSEVSSRFGTEAFAQRVAVTTGVFVPEIKKLIMRDLDQYLANLAATALPSILTLSPNESRDGYVFFPRGAIYGYGVDEFSLNNPSYIVNIDNDDVAVDGALIEGEVQFSAGQKAVDSQVQAARNQGQKQVSDDLTKLADLQMRIFSYRLVHISNNICELIAAKKITEAKAYLDNAIKGEKDAAESPIVKELKARIEGGILCDKPLTSEK